MHAVKVAAPGMNTADAVRAAEALNADCRFEEADALILGLRRERPQDFPLTACHVSLAVWRGDWAGVRERAREARGLFAHEPVGHRFGVRAAYESNLIDEAMALQSAAESLFAKPRLLWTLYEGARLAEARGEMEEAERYFTSIRDAFPTVVDGRLDLAHFYMRANRMEAAERAIDDALTRFGDDPTVHMAQAEIALHFARWELADARHQAALARFPAHFDLAFQYANAPLHGFRGKVWEAAAARHETLRATFPMSQVAFQSSLSVLRRLKDNEGAGRLAVIALERFPRDERHVSLGVEIERVREERGDPEGAISGLRDLARQAPNDILPRVELSAMLSRQGGIAEAEAVCAEGIARFRYRIGLHAEYARLATLRGAKAEAVARWKAASDIRPRDKSARVGLFVTRLALAEDLADPSSPENASRDEAKGALSHLMYQFESLGGPTMGGCEFGLVQRYFDAEPLGLLRWGSISLKSLMAALAGEFEGLGAPERTSFGPLPASGLYSVRDSRFEMEFHTFVAKGDVAEDVLLERWRKQLAYLGKKLVRDLRAAEKIFIFRPDKAPAAPEIDALSEAMNRFGDPRLLIIQLADETHGDGTAAWVRPNVMIGYIDRLNWTPETDYRAPSFASWARVCLAARALRGGKE
jgi:tetratricopeptide (TPR) repeat protein